MYCTGCRSSDSLLTESSSAIQSSSPRKVLTAVALDCMLRNNNYTCQLPSQSWLTPSMLVKILTEDILKYFFIYPRKRDWTFHANCLLRSQTPFPGGGEGETNI